MIKNFCGSAQNRIRTAAALFCIGLSFFSWSGSAQTADEILAKLKAQAEAVKNSGAGSVPAGRVRCPTCMHGTHGAPPAQPAQPLAPVAVPAPQVHSPQHRSPPPTHDRSGPAVRPEVRAEGRRALASPPVPPPQPAALPLSAAPLDAPAQIPDPPPPPPGPQDQVQHQAQPANAPTNEEANSSSSEELSCRSDANELLRGCLKLSLSATATEGTAFTRLMSRLPSVAETFSSASTMRSGASGSLTKSLGLLGSCTELATTCTTQCAERVKELEAEISNKQGECQSARQQSIANHPSCTYLPRLREAIDQSVRANDEICVARFGEEVAKHRGEAADAQRMVAEADAAMKASAAATPSGAAGEGLAAAGGRSSAAYSAAGVPALVDEGSSQGGSIGTETLVVGGVLAAGLGGAAILGGGGGSNSNRGSGANENLALNVADETAIQECGLQNASDRCTTFKKDYCAEQAEAAARPQLVSSVSDSADGALGRGRGTSYCNQIAQKIWCDQPVVELA